MNSLIQRRLAANGGLTVAVWALAFAFISYFCMYAFRKPFTAGTYLDVADWNFPIDFKSAIIISQVIGYALSKLVGVKVVSEAGDKGRTFLILGLILFSEFALVLFAIVPAPYKPIAMFLNGLPLGMIWGLVFRYLEGRRTSEFLGAGLCTSFIVSSGFVKSAGWMLIDDFHVPEIWMPAATGLLFLPLICLSVWLLSLTPPPDRGDVEARMARAPMDRKDRSLFIDRYGVGLLFIGVSFVALGALRDFRDNFAVDIWKAVGFDSAPEILTLSEIPAALLVLVALSLIMLVKNNRKAVLTIHLLMVSGIVLAVAATAAYQLHLIGPLEWMVVLGAGVYLGYVPCTSILADRLMASLRSGGNAGFMMYLLDAWAYGGSVGVLLFRSIASPDLPWLSFFIGLIYVALGVGLVGTVLSMMYFDRESTTGDAPARPAPAPELKSADAKA